VPQDIDEQIPMKVGRKGKLLEVLWTENLSSTFEASIKILLYTPPALTLTNAPFFLVEYLWFSYDFHNEQRLFP
jgi:hypothetical protein